MSSDINTVINLLYVGDRLYEIVGLFIILISTIGNLCNCFVFLCIPPLNKHPNNLFLIGSSIGSFIYINIGLYSALIRIWTGIDPSNRWLFWCKLATWLTYSAGCFSFMCHCLSALSQYLLTLPKVKWQRLITPIRAQLIIYLSAIFWLFVFIPLVIYYNHIETSTKTYTCQSSRPFITIYGTYWIIIGYYFLPIILILLLFCLTWINLKQILRRHRTLTIAITRMMLIQMSVLLISGLPAGFYLSYILATQYSKKTLLRLGYEYLILLILTLFTFFTNGISFWIYLIASKTFRKNIKQFLFKFYFLKNQVRPFTMTITRLNPPH
ncbi:unnamed protein product [Rotaria sp. Silwood2]|nr:unnamed protein product [Rotaria sp. Silwood2]CAF3247408.1 unnamed protein product [Rotaria sp. Silwood2]CAF3414148.1 unnamed protein product [Rotaria sp. Silwood2]CAF4372988.1 unnamed protein product [Rotaria sp. Silwood2]CAF4524487.1 unnamed protein product [Rotaria sp. Silwood2]